MTPAAQFAAALCLALVILMAVEWLDRVLDQ